MKNKKIIIGIILAVVIIATITIGIIWLLNKQEEDKIKSTLTEFISSINEKNYEAMYDKVVSNMSKEDFITRNKNIYEGIESKNIKIENITLEKQGGDIFLVNYHENMFTGAGEVEFDNQVQVQKQDNDYKLKWSSKFIFPQLSDNQKVRISTIKAKRGEILDRNNVKLASNGTILSCRNSTSEN